MKVRYDEKALASTAYNAGDVIMFRNSVIQNDESAKFHLSYCGSHRVVKYYHL